MGTTTQNTLHQLISGKAVCDHFIDEGIGCEMKIFHVARVLLLGLVLVGVGTAVACNTAEEATNPATEEPTSEVAVPDEVMVVREAALEHLRTIAQIMVPPESTPWQST